MVKKELERRTVRFIDGNVSSVHEVPYKKRSPFIERRGYSAIPPKSKSFGAVSPERLMALKYSQELRTWARRA